jgi:hypothetical protein
MRRRDMKVGPKEQQTRMLGPTGIQRQLGSPLKAGYTERKPVTKKAVTLRKSVTNVTKQLDHFVTADNSVTRKRGRPLKGEVAMTDAERQRASRARKRITNPPKRITALQGD